MVRNLIAILAAAPVAAMVFPVASGHASAVSLLSPPPVAMHSAPSAPRADLRLYAHTAHTVWSGTGDAWDAIDLCLASSTGRYRLRIASLSGGALMGPGKLRYTLSLTDGAGVSHDVTLQDQVLVAIEGQAPADATCDRGPNATLRLRAPQDELLKGQAGRYLDRLRLAIDPL
ncbi:hypothetical protein [Novosphingobium sp.]|uniref:hypothetical protein n=1 Tax=Novosphingobium sp. TaxID=1874826 RepID=UPI0031DE6C7A